MRKKWRILFRRVSGTQAFESDVKIGAHYQRAKELYFINFANHMTMKKNGEFNEYIKFRIPKETEHEWSLEVKDKLMDEICSGSNLLQVVQLARVNLPKSEILHAFELLSLSSLKDKILASIEQLKPLFEPSLYKEIVKLFSLDVRSGL